MEQLHTLDRTALLQARGLTELSLGLLNGYTMRYANDLHPHQYSLIFTAGHLAMIMTLPLGNGGLKSVILQQEDMGLVRPEDLPMKIQNRIETWINRHLSDQYRNKTWDVVAGIIDVTLDSAPDLMLDALRKGYLLRCRVGEVTYELHRPEPGTDYPCTRGYLDIRFTPPFGLKVITTALWTIDFTKEYTQREDLVTLLEVHDLQSKSWAVVGAHEVLDTNPWGRPDINPVPMGQVRVFTTCARCGCTTHVIREQGKPEYHPECQVCAEMLYTEMEHA